MKICLLVIIALLSAQGVTAQPTSNQPDCSASANYYRSTQVKLLGLELLVSPIKISGTCGQEWSEFGTCCKVDQLTALVKRDAAYIDYGVKTMTEEYKSMIVFLQKELMPRLTAIDQTLKSSNWKTVSQEDAKSLKQLVNSPELLFLIEKAAHDDKDSVEERIKECWNYQGSLRAKAVCSTCSANSKRFYTEEKGNVREEICDELIDKCALPLFKMNRLVDAYQALYENQEFLERLGIKINAKQKLVKSFKIALHRFKSPFAGETLQREYHLAYPVYLKRDREMKDSYCEYMARLNLCAKPYIVLFAKNINSNVPWTISTKTNRSLSSIATSASPMPRSLDLKDQSQNILGLGDDGALETKDIRIMANNGDSNVQVSRIPGLGQMKSMLSGMNFP